VFFRPRMEFEGIRPRFTLTPFQTRFGRVQSLSCHDTLHPPSCTICGTASARQRGHTDPRRKRGFKVSRGRRPRSESEASRCRDAARLQGMKSKARLQGVSEAVHLQGVKAQACLQAVSRQRVVKMPRQFPPAGTRNTMEFKTARCSALFVHLSPIPCPPHTPPRKKAPNCSVRQQTTY
jgi:hypothetical protein